MRTLFGILALLLIGWALPVHAEPLPTINEYVTDLSNALPDQAEEELRLTLARFAKERGSQVLVVIVPTTGQEPIEQFTLRLAERASPGRKEFDDGVILLVALEDRAVRIEVGYGLEGALTDVLSKRIIEDIILPHFRAGDIPAGVREGVHAILATIEGEALPAPAQRTPVSERGDASAALFWLSLLAGMFLVPLIGRGWAALFAGGATVLLGALFSSVFLGIIVGLVVMLILLFGNAVPAAGRYRGGRGWGGGFGGALGGGFRGGGGGFGGGGASGRW